MLGQLPSVRSLVRFSVRSAKSSVHSHAKRTGNRGIKECGQKSVFQAPMRNFQNFRGSLAMRAYSNDTKDGWTSPPAGAEALMSKMKLSGEMPDPGDTGPFKKGFLGGMGWGAFLLFCTIGGVAWWWGRKRRLEIEASRKRVTSSGDARIGGLWSLVDHEGRPRTSADFKGQYTLIYFGFTYCPDICPEELKKMAKAINMLPEAAQIQILPLMISVDPWRDSIAQLAGYVQEFHPRMLGLVGTPQQVDHITRAFRVYTSKGPEENEGDYLMDHSIFMYLMDKEGKFLDYYGVAMDAEEIAESIQNHLAERHDIAEPGIIGAIKFWWYHKDAKVNP